MVVRSETLAGVGGREWSGPRAGVDYPGTWQAFESWFADDDACRAYLERLRWPDGFRCPVRGVDGVADGSGLWMCASCQRKTSVTAGTIFHRSHLPLRVWFAACWFVCSQKNGVSALGLQRVLGLGSYESAWALMHKLRRAMVRPDRAALSGSSRSTRRSSERANTQVAGPIAAPRRRSRSPSRSTTRRASDASACATSTRCRPTPSAGSSTTSSPSAQRCAPTAGTATRRSPRPLRTRRHQRGTSAEPAHVDLPGVHRVASLLKRWLEGTLQSGFAHSHLDYYLDEFTFRFNRRTSRRRGLLFYRLLQQAVITDPHPRDQFLAKTRRPASSKSPHIDSLHSIGYPLHVFGSGSTR